MAHAEASLMQIEVAYAPDPKQVERVTVMVPMGAVLEQAVQASGLLERFGLQARSPGLSFGVWSKIKPLNHPLREGDRVEIYRPLKVDPKEARRQRYRKQGGRAGLRRRGPSGPA